MLDLRRPWRAPSALALATSLFATGAAPALASPSDYGSWLVWADAPMLAIHAALMPPKDANSPATILMFGGSQYEPSLQVGAPLGPVSRNSWAEMNTQTGVMRTLSLDSTQAGVTDDLFCGAQAHDADGNLLIVGGTEYYPGNTAPLLPGEMPSNIAPVEPCFGAASLIYPDLWGQSINRRKCALDFTGHNGAWRYNYQTATLTAGPRLARGRWYPTIVRSDNSSFPSLAVISGLPSASDPSTAHFNNDVESIAANTTGTSWRRMTDTLQTAQLYPRAFLTPYLGGSVVVASPRASSLKSSVLMPNTSGTFSSIDFAQAVVPKEYQGYHTSAVLMPFRPDSNGNYGNGKIMMTNDEHPQLLNLNDPTPKWRDTSPRTFGKMRMDAIATILATGDILVSGGMDPSTHFDPIFPNQDDGYDNAPNQSVPQAEIYREDLGTWQEGPAANVVRHYHSTALLLPNGTVLTAGGNKHSKFSRTYQPFGEGRILKTEAFVPWYAQSGVPRPGIAATISQPPRTGSWTIDLSFGTPGRVISRVALIAPGSVTHAFDVDQRYVELLIEARTETSVTVRVPGNRNILPGGMYMLFVSWPSNSNPAGAHIPSVAKWVRVPVQ